MYVSNENKREKMFAVNSCLQMVVTSKVVHTCILLVNYSQMFNKTKVALRKHDIISTELKLTRRFKCMLSKKKKQLIIDGLIHQNTQSLRNLVKMNVETCFKLNQIIYYRIINFTLIFIEF